MRQHRERAAQLLDEEGELVDEVPVFLQYQEQGGLGQWGGHIEPVNLSPTDWDQVRQIRLGDGGIADCLVEHEVVTDGGVRKGRIRGSGPCPF